jgi:undecaprenyl-diphosphatase
MNMENAILLGIIQGLTEFLPVSSSAHLVIAQSFLKGFHQTGILFDIVLHMGTLVAVIFFLRKEIYALLKALLPASFYSIPPSYTHRAAVSTERKTIRDIIIATLVTGIIGFSFKEEVEKLFASPAVAAFMLVITGVLLFLAGRVKNTRRGENGITAADSIIIGIAQGVAIIPGISRSGATIALGIFRGLAHETAARFSFLLSIPAVMGALVLEARHISVIPYPDIKFYAAGFAMAAIVGFLSLKLLFLMLKNRRLEIFAYYCWAVGFSVLLLNTFSH